MFGVDTGSRPDLSRSYNNARVVVDPWQAFAMIQRLRSRAISIKEFTFTSASVGRLAVTLAQLIANHELALPDDRQLLDELARVRLRESAPGVIRMDHNPGEHDDQAIAIALAAQELLTRTASRLTIATASHLRIPLRSGPRNPTAALPPVASPFLRQLLKTRGPFE